MTYSKELKDFEERMKQPLIQLQHCVSRLDYEGVTRFFQQYLPLDMNYSSNCMMLVQMILRDSQFFSGKAQQPSIKKSFDDFEDDEDSLFPPGFKNKLNSPSTSSSTLSEKEKENQRLRYFYVLNHLSIQAQVFLLQDAVLHGKDADHRYFEVTKNHIERLSDNLKNRALNSSVWGKIISHLFLKEQFSFIDTLQEQFDFDFLQVKQDFMLLHYEEQDSLNSQGKGIQRNAMVKFDKACFKPYFYIMFEYSEKKETYLSEKNILLPVAKDMTYLSSILRQQIFVQNEADEQKQRWLQNMAEYDKRLEYYHLKEKVEAVHGQAPEQTGTEHKIKI